MLIDRIVLSHTVILYIEFSKIRTKKQISSTKNGGVINGNEISPYNQAYDINGELTEKANKIITI